MSDIWGRVLVREGAPVVGTRGTPLGEVLDRLESGESPAHVVASLPLDAADLIAALGHAALGGEDATGPTLVQAAPRRPRLAPALSEGAWSEVLPSASRPMRLALAAGLFQVHDFWDASHDAAQRAGDLGERETSAYWHGIAHRREPDPGNASYWFRRVGRHPLFGRLASVAAPLLEAHDATLAARLIPGGVWDPSAFIDLCAGSRSGSALERLAGTLQRLEMKELLQATASPILP